MQGWEYLNVHIAGGNWQDSNGRSGIVPIAQMPASDRDFPDSSTLSAALGRDGWELVAVAAETIDMQILFFKRPLD